MTKDLLQVLVEDPTKIFNNDSEKKTYFNLNIKDLLDSIVDYSKLDEIYIDGLDSNQIFGQSKIVIDSAGQMIMERLAEREENEDIPELSQDEGSQDEQDEGQSEEVEEQDVEDDEGDDDDDDEEEDEGGEDEDEVEVEDGKNDIDQEDVSDIEKYGIDELGDRQDDDEGLEDNETSQQVSAHKEDKFGLNDGFFDIDEFNKQILALENNDDEVNDDEDENIDYFNSVSDEDDEIDYYDDFYDKPQSAQPNVKKQLFDDDENDDSDENDEIHQEAEDQEGENQEYNEEEYDNAIGSMRQDLYEKSSFEKQQEHINKEIKSLEDELVAEKKWSMKGEVKSDQRPEDSLLTDKESFQFDRVSKPVPIITEEITETIEDLIRKRIKNDEFNDLPKRFLNDIIKPQRERVEVPETKSTKSLAEIYEDKYTGNETNEKEEKINQDHQEISELFNKLNYKLDSLTSFNFIPKPHENKVIEIKNNTISMEDSQPEFVSNESRLAPQEIFNKSKGDNEISLKSGLSYTKDELSRPEKQRLRRAMKRKTAKRFENSNKKQKPDSVLDTLSGNKNLTVINKKGEMTDVKGNTKKSHQTDSTNLKL